MRKLATIRKIDAINPIEGADAIEVATVGGWKVVVKKGEFAVGDLAIYCEIDSWIPHALAPFLSKGKEPREFEGVKGERLRTIKLRGQLSQGLLLPLEASWVIKNLGAGPGAKFSDYEGVDVTEHLNIKKWEKPVPAQLAGQVKGNFPSQIPKTDQERVQNLVKELVAADGAYFEVTEKLEGSSMTVYRNVVNGEMQFGVCSRNLDLKQTEGNAFWNVAIKEDIEAKMIAVDEFWSFAIQGELVGPGIQGNIYGLSQPQFYVFDVYNIQSGEYLPPAARRELVAKMGLKHVPIIDEKFFLEHSVEEILDVAEGKSQLADAEREGIVFKCAHGGLTFKAISNKYLINEK